jgi:multidrug efflux system outer membrane protein
MRLVATALVMILAAGCTLGPDYVRPEIQAPDGWTEPVATDSTAANLPWFDLFSDSVLVGMIDTTLRENRDLRVAIGRIDEAAATVGIVRADLFPRLNYGGGGFVDGNSVSDWDPELSASGFLGLSWQIDLWGRVRRSEEAALQTVLAREASVRGVTLSLVSAVARSYLLLLDLDNRLGVAERTVDIRRDNLEIIQARFDGGSVSVVDLNQARIQLADAEAAVQTFTRLRKQTENSLSLLMGRPPSPIARGRHLQDQINVPVIPAGLPSDLIERRPDIMEAERELHAQTARIGAAEALKFPQFNLAANLGGTLADPSLGVYDAGVQLFGPLFNSGENQRRVEVEEARTWQLLAVYEQTILNAWREVEDALVAVSTYEAEYEARVRQMDAASEAAEVAWVRYEGGLTSYLEILETQRSLFGTQLSASETYQLWLSSVVELYAALGGGWQTRSVE